MAIVLKKNSVAITSSVDWTSINLTLVLTKEVCRLSFKIKNYGTKSTLVLGDQVDLYEGATHLFGGTVTDKENIVSGGILIETLYTCCDWSFRLNSTLVVQTYTDDDPQTIVRDILTEFTDGTFGSTNVILAGVNVPTIRFNYEQVTTAIEKLANLIGWEWYVDADKDVHFFPPSTVVTGPYTIDDTGGNLEWTSLQVDQNLTNMKNSIFVIGGTYVKTLTSTTTPDIYLTDSTKAVFSLAYAYDPTTIIVTLNAVAQTVGTDQATDPTTVQVLYNQASRFVRFTTVPPTTTGIVKIYGDALIPILAHIQNSASILAYGEIQDAIIDQQIQSIEEAQERAQSEIDKYGSPVYVVKFSTLKTGFQVGQTVRINSTLFSVNILVVIKRITGKMYSPTQMHYDIECVGSGKVTFIDIMKLLLLQNKANTVVSDSTILEVLLLLDEATTVSDTLSPPTSTTGPYKYDTAICNFSTYG